MVLACGLGCFRSFRAAAAPQPQPQPQPQPLSSRSRHPPAAPLRTNEEYGKRTKKTTTEPENLRPQQQRPGTGSRRRPSWGEPGRSGGRGAGVLLLRVSRTGSRGARGRLKEKEREAESRLRGLEIDSIFTGDIFLSPGT